jgi:pimeloyl-ACP methyl ester carboxylesterase
MPIAEVRGVSLNYEVIGAAGPWMTLSPGGRRPLGHVRALAGRFADAGYRVLIHDRRNCGASDVSFAGGASEYEIWADDLHALLTQLGAVPAIAGGGSSGCRLSLLLALRHPQAVRALLLWRITGGRFAGERLAENYYGQFITAARNGGMSAVATMEHWRERIQDRPANRARLLDLEVNRFIDVMEHWQQYFLAGAELPVIGCSAVDLESIKVPTAIIPGNDRTHGLAIGRNAHRIMRGSELFELFTRDEDLDIVPMEDWADKEPDIARLFLDFLKRRVS